MNCRALVWTLSWALYALGCGGGDDERREPQRPTSDALAPVAPDGGSAPSPEYDDLIYDPDDGRWLSGAGSFPEQADSANAFLVDLFLQEDGSFVLFYAEANGEVWATGHSVSTLNGRQFKETGTWKVTQTALEVGQLMACNKITMNSRPALYCNVEQAIGHDAAVGRNVTLRQTLTSSSPDDSEWAEYK
jgi:hypothetical protein